MTKELDARPAFENSHLVAQDQIDHIRALLAAIPDYHATSATWPMVGSMTQINALLSEVIATLNELNGRRT